MQTSDKTTVGRVFNVQRCSLHDGPGIRTTVFMKGCPLRCAWCQNPEGLSHEISFAHDVRRCISCHSCEGKSKEEGASVCPAGALTAFGRDYTVSELVGELLADLDFFGEQGGVTFSGGECLLQSDFVLECAKELSKRKIKVAVDTCGAVDYRSIEKLIPYTDLFLYDVKCISEKKHIENTGVTNREILSNFEKLYASDARIWVRIPIVNGFNTDKDELLLIKEYLDRFPNIEKIEPLRYHELGIHKYELLGKPYTLSDSAKLSDGEFEEIKKLLGK